MHAAILGKCKLKIVFWMTGLKNDTIKSLQQELTGVLLAVFRKNRSAVDPTLVAWSLDDTATNMAKINASITAEKQVIDLIDIELLKSYYPAQIRFIDLLYKETSKNAELKKHNIKFISIEGYEVVELTGGILAQYE